MTATTSEPSVGIRRVTGVLSRVSPKHLIAGLITLILIPTIYTMVEEWSLRRRERRAQAPDYAGASPEAAR